MLTTTIQHQLKIAVAERAEGGRANEAAVKTVASLLNVTRSAASLVAGKTSRRKRLFVRGIRPDKGRELTTAVIGNPTRTTCG